MNEASRMGITAHITRWINNIQQYDNVPMDLTVYNLVLEAESNLRNVYNKFKQLTEAWWQRVTRDIKQAGVTQEQFDAEIDSQIQVEEDVGDALIIVKRKREEFKEIERSAPALPALSPLERPATSLDTPQPFSNDSLLIKSSCTSQVLEDPVPSEKHQPPDTNPEKMASLSQSEGPATSLDSSVNLLSPGSELESAASLSQSEGPATSLDSSANLLPPDSKPESTAAPSFSETPASPLDKRQSSPKDPQHAVLSLLRRSASVPGRQHDSTRKKNKSTPSVKPIILKTQTKQKNPDETEPPSEEAPEADDDKQTDLTASLEKFRTRNSPTRKRLERVTPLRLDKESAKAENLIDQLLRVKLSIQVSNTNLSQQLINVFVLVTEVRSKNLQFVWDPGGKATNRVSRLSLGPAPET
jgi:hypothetical protein